MSLAPSLPAAPPTGGSSLVTSPLRAGAPLGASSLTTTVPAPRTSGEDADALPLPSETWGVAEARQAVAEAELVLPFRLRGAEVVSALTTVVLRAGDVAVKVYPPGTDAQHLARTARALGGSVTALLPLREPVVTSWGVVQVSPWVTATAAVTWSETGALLRRFHEAHAGAPVAEWHPLRRLVTQVAGLPDDAARVLLDARAELLRALGSLHSPLGVGVVHGDVSPANVLHGADGPVLIDLDFVARAPREYDLTSAARRFEAGEIDRAAYRGFCDAYGSDVRSWEGRVLLDRVAQLGGVAFRLWDDRRRGTPMTWLDDAVATWRTPL